MRLRIFVFFIGITFVLAASGAFVRTGQLLKESRQALNNGEYTLALKLADSVFNATNNNITKIEANALRAKANINLGKINTASKIYQEVWDIAKNSFDPSNPSYQNALFNYAQFLGQAGRYKECISLLQEVPEEVNDDFKADVLALRGTTLTYLKQYDAALESLDSAINIAKNIPEFRDLPVIFQNRAFLKNEIHDYKGSLQDYNIALPMLAGKNRGITLANMAIVNARDKDFKHAFKNIDKALKILKSYGNLDEDYIIALRKKGEILHLAGKKKEASKIMREFFELEKQRLSVILPTLSPQTRLDYWTKEKPLLSRVFLTGAYDPKLSMDVALMRRITSLMGSDSVHNTIHKLNERTEDIAAKLKPNEGAVAFILYEDEQNNLQNAALTLDSKGKTSFVPLFPQDSIKDIIDDIDLSLQEIVTLNYPSAKNYLYRDSIIANALWQPILRAFPDEVTVVHFAPEGIFHLWGIENMPFAQRDSILPIRHFALNEIQDSYHNEFSPALIIGGIDYDSLPNDTTFVTTINNNTEAYDEIIRNTSSTRGSGIFSYLPGTRMEAQGISMQLDSISPKDQLSESEFKSISPNYSLIHLATHGYTFSPDIDINQRTETDSLGYDMSLWSSGVALTGANISALNGLSEDGILAAREICDLNLSNSSLIILSACETAQGFISDESASGLIRALKNAGAKTIVASLWEVDDESTSFFMTEFYKALQQGIPKIEAFELARKNTREKIKETPQRNFKLSSSSNKKANKKVQRPYSEPWFWAPFIIIDP